MGLQRRDQVRDALDEGIVDDSLVLVRLDLGLAPLTLLVNLLLLRPDEGLFVDIGVNFDVGIIAELQRVLPWWETSVRGCQLLGNEAIPICCNPQAS